jgi:hypothetical protein
MVCVSSISRVIAQETENCGKVIRAGVTEPSEANEIIDRYGAGDPERSRAYVAEMLSAKSSVGRAGGIPIFSSRGTGQFSGREKLLVLSTTKGALISPARSRSLLWLALGTTGR